MIKMKTIKLENGELRITSNIEKGLYDCKYYEYYFISKTYSLIYVEERCTKEYVEETYNIELDF
jgi:hypothetical protein